MNEQRLASWVIGIAITFLLAVTLICIAGSIVPARAWDIEVEAEIKDGHLDAQSSMVHTGRGLLNTEDRYWMDLHAAHADNATFSHVLGAGGTELQATIDSSSMPVPTTHIQETLGVAQVSDSACCAQAVGMEANTRLIDKLHTVGYPGEDCGTCPTGFDYLVEAPLIQGGSIRVAVDETKIIQEADEDENITIHRERTRYEIAADANFRGEVKDFRVHIIPDPCFPGADEDVFPFAGLCPGSWGDGLPDPYSFTE